MGACYDIEIKAQSSHFVTIEQTKEKSKQELLAIPRNAFEKCFENWKKRRHRGVTLKREVTLKGTR